MTEEEKTQLEEDVTLAKKMATITSSQEITALNIRLVGYLEALEAQEAEYEYKAKKLKSKSRTLMEYIRIGKQRMTQIGIIEHEYTKTYTK